MEYFISDFHFGHRRILEFERKQFSSIEEHNEYIVKKYNERIMKDDTCWILGDLGVRGGGTAQESLVEYFNKLNGEKKIILGNHDHYSKDFYKSLKGVTEVYDHPVYIAKRILLSHEPVKCNGDCINIHGHLHGADLSLPNYINVSAHLIDYTPISRKKIEHLLFNIPKESHRFMYEWYAPYYVFTNKKDEVIMNDDGTINIEATRIELEKGRERRNAEMG